MYVEIREGQPWLTNSDRSQAVRLDGRYDIKISGRGVKIDFVGIQSITVNGPVFANVEIEVVLR